MTGREPQFVESVPEDDLRRLEMSVEEIAELEAERDRYREALETLASPAKRLRIDQGQSVTAYVRGVLDV